MQLTQNTAEIWHITRGLLCCVLDVTATRQLHCGDASLQDMNAMVLLFLLLATVLGAPSNGIGTIAWRMAVHLEISGSDRTAQCQPANHSLYGNDSKPGGAWLKATSKAHQPLQQLSQLLTLHQSFVRAPAALTSPFSLHVHTNRPGNES